MGRRDPMRKLQPNPKLTKELRVIASIIARVMAEHEPAITAALTDPETRREMKQLVNDLASLVAVIQDTAKQRATGGTP